MRAPRWVCCVTLWTDVAQRPNAASGAGGRFAGCGTVLGNDWKTEPTASMRRRSLNPRFAEPDPEIRIGILDDYKTFIAEYRDARALWMLTGSAVFPAGTNKLRDYPGVSVRGRPAVAMRG